MSGLLVADDDLVDIGLARLLALNGVAHPSLYPRQVFPREGYQVGVIVARLVCEAGLQLCQLRVQVASAVVHDPARTCPDYATHAQAA